jgi:hypothetical protein
VVVLTPDGGQLINMGIGRGFVFSVVSQKTAARYTVERSKLQTPIMLDGPSNQQVRATELCTIAFPQDKAVGGEDGDLRVCGGHIGGVPRDAHTTS